MKNSYRNSPFGSVWALATSILITYPAIGIAFAQIPSNKPDFRVVHFPEDRSLGQLYIRDAENTRELSYWFHWTGTGEADWEFLSEARGDIPIPPGKHLSLTINRAARQDLSPLTKLRPDDLYALSIPGLSDDPSKPDDRCMPYIGHLTGLRFLNLDRTNITDRGFVYIKNLQALEYLYLPPRITDRSMRVVAGLRSLKGLYCGTEGSLITNAGLQHLSKRTTLEELYLKGERMSDAGLAHLRDLPRLEYLCLYGSHFTDRGMVHVKMIPSLRVLSFHEGLCRITDAGLVHISRMPNLEILCFHGMKHITDAGLVHLPKLQKLRKLNIGSSPVTDRGLAYLAQIKTLERLDLPQDQKGITDEGLSSLGTLPNLKHLSISRIYFKDPTKNKTYYTDKGLVELINCHLLEELNIGSIGITDAGINSLVKLKNLKKLMLFGCENVTDAGLAKLTALKSLKTLRIKHSQISIEGLSHLKSMPNLTELDIYPIERNGATLDLSGLTALENLSLSFGSYSEKFVDADLECLAQLERIKWLQIGPRDYTDKGMAYLAGLTDMERLGIGGSGLTDEGLTHLANMKKLNHLTILSGYDSGKRDYVSGGNITDEGLRQLEQLKQLRFLNIYSDNTFSDATLRRLWSNLPNLSSLRINGGRLLKIDSKN